MLRVLRRGIARDKKEYFDSAEQLQAKAAQLAEMIKNTQHCIAFTGAGLSTSSGIPDFRSSHGTVIETGPGIWERGKDFDDSHLKRVDSLKAVPSTAHLAIAELVEAGLIKHIISQNVDGIHRKSGVSREFISELHGNVTLEACVDCGTQYFRDFRIKRTDGKFTGRTCDDHRCNGLLVDSLVRFGESLNKELLKEAFEHAQRADMCLAIGSSLSVAPAAHFPRLVAEKSEGKLVIANLQKTQLDRVAHLRLFGKTDEIMCLVMNKLGLKIPEYRVKRYLALKKRGQKVEIQGTDREGRPHSFLKSVKVDDAHLNQEPYSFTLETRKKISLLFHGHYNEPNFEFDLHPDSLQSGLNYILTFNPFTSTWESFTPT